MRRAAKTDAAQAAIVGALRACGATVWPIGLPVDLLVGFQGRSVLMEVKTLVGKRKPRPARYTALQTEFMAAWRGAPVVTVTSMEEAVAALRLPATQ